MNDLFRTYLVGHGLRAVALRAVAGSVGVRIIGMAFAFLVGIQLARGMGPVGYGTYGIAMSIIALLMVPTEFGLPQLVVRETAANAARGEWGKVKGILNWSRKISLQSFLLVALPVCAVLVIAGRRIDGPLSIALLSGLAMIPLVAVGKTRAAALRGLKHIVKGQMPDAILRPGVQSLLLFAVAAFSFTLTPSIAMLMGVVGASVGLAASALMLRRALPIQIKLAAPQTMTKEWRSSCIPMAMTEAMRMMQAHLAILVLGAMAAPASVGIYKVATAVSLIVMTPTAIFISVVSPLISAMFVGGDQARLQKLLSWTTAGIVASTALLSAPIFFAAPYAINLVFGGEFAAAAVPLQILCVGGLLTATAGTAGTLLNMTGHEISVRRASFQSLLLLLVLLPLFIRWAGATGAAVATVCSGLFWRMRMVNDCRILLGLEPGLLGFLARGVNRW